jgi:hypothetical protein
MTFPTKLLKFAGEIKININISGDIRWKSMYINTLFLASIDAWIEMENAGTHEPIYYFIFIFIF